MTVKNRVLLLAVAGSLIGAGAIVFPSRGRTPTPVHASARDTESVQEAVELLSPEKRDAATEKSQAARRAPVEPEAEGTWVRPLDQTPFDVGPGTALVPVIAGDRVLVSTTLRLVCVDAVTGELAWERGPPEGWQRLTPEESSRLFRGVDHQQLVFPAVGAGIVVAALQLPFSGDPSDQEWSGIEIMRTLPQRRLFAFDLQTGRELWSHSVSLEWGDERWEWDGRGDFAQSQRVAGSPVIVDQRVLVPCYGAEGRITYQVGCYGLRTGRPLWATYVTNGQRPRNSFGRLTEEFVAAPLVVAGSRVVAQTGLGKVAALDLATGRVVWESTYRSKPLPRPRSYNTPQWRLTWRVTPPVIVGDVVVCAPVDSDHLVAFHLGDGRLLWEVEEQELRTPRPGQVPRRFDHLLGAEPDTVFLAGTKVGALRKPRGLASPSAFQPGWTFLLGTEPGYPPRLARALLHEHGVVLPGRDRYRLLDRASGAELDAFADRPRLPYGNIGTDGDTMVVLSRKGLHGFVRPREEPR